MQDHIDAIDQLVNHAGMRPETRDWFRGLRNQLASVQAQGGNNVIGVQVFGGPSAEVVRRTAAELADKQTALFQEAFDTHYRNRVADTATEYGAKAFGVFPVPEPAGIGASFRGDRTLEAMQDAQAFITEVNASRGGDSSGTVFFTIEVPLKMFERLERKAYQNWRDPGTEAVRILADCLSYNPLSERDKAEAIAKAETVAEKMTEEAQGCDDRMSPKPSLSVTYEHCNVPADRTGVHPWQPTQLGEYRQGPKNGESL